MSFVLILECILGLIIFLSGGSEESRNGALNVVDFSIFSLFENIEASHSYIRVLLTTSPI